MNHLGGQGYFEFGEGGNKRNHVYGNLFVLCSKGNHLGNLEIEHVSPIVALVYSHMLLWLWLSQLHWEDPCIVFRLTENEGTRNPTWVPEDKLAMVYGRTLWKDFVTFSICQYSILVSTYPAATGGNKMRVCHVGKVYNFCRRPKF